MIYFGANPVMFQAGSFSLRWYGMFLTLAVVWVIFWMWLQIKKSAGYPFVGDDYSYSFRADLRAFTPRYR
jgi:prolipoprotein diacylglyceryltransferase